MSYEEVPEFPKWTFAISKSQNGRASEKSITKANEITLPLGGVGVIILSIMNTGN